MGDSTFEQWRNRFQDVVREPENAGPLKSASQAEDLKSWTSSLTATVVKSCAALGWPAAAKGHPLEHLPQVGQEYLSIDVMAFPPTRLGRWPAPEAVFELENRRTDDRVAYSLWKVLCVRAKLRVVFAFRRDWDKSRETVAAMNRDVIGSLSASERDTLLGETVLIVGNRGEDETFPWGYFKMWKLDPNVGRFEKV